ncbi:hypothetical protein MRX96_002221 [Rhipicephalus microplus]
MRFVWAFVVSRVTLLCPYLQLTKANRDTLNTMLSKATKPADVVVHAETAWIGAHNAVEKLIETHLSSQRVRPSQRKHGRTVLRKIGRQKEPQPARTALPGQLKETIKGKPICIEHVTENDAGIWTM